MKKSLFVLVCILGLWDISLGQNFEPGEQAKGYLDNKNVSIDYSTGTLHYAIPLFSITSGEYTLPIFLQYSSRGVKMDAFAGMCGYNWNLNTGGVITRTVRGGIADEQNRGMEGPSVIIPPTRPLPEPTCYVEEVRDEEHDIFTAIFNGKSVNFIIRKNIPQKEWDFIIEPLEKTNVKIEHGLVEKDSLGYLIHDWIVTDVDGTRYIYKQKEWVFNAVAEDVAGRNVENERFVSSWYLTEIDIPNADNIYFWYENPDKCPHYSPDEEYRGEYVWNNNNSVFYFQLPHKEPSWDFEKYRGQFENYIRIAEEAINEQIMGELNDNVYGYYNRTLTKFYHNPLYSYNEEKIRLHKSLQGTIQDFYEIQGVSQELVDALNVYYVEFKSNPIVKDAINRAKELIRLTCMETRSFRTSSMPLVKRIIVQTPVLELITCKDKVIQLFYTRGNYPNYSYNYFHRLDNIRLRDNAYQDIEMYKLEYTAKNNLYQIVHKDNNSQVIDWQRFSYYYEDFKNLYDKWGYSSNITPIPHTLNHKGKIGDLDSVYCKKGSLQMITSSTGRNIMIEYESNKRNKNGVLENYGGIRLKSLVSKNIDGAKDSVSYKYPQGGLLVFPDVTNIEIVEYNRTSSFCFKDTLVKSLVDYKGGAFLNTGNNGLYYPYVEEHLIGKGWNTYLYSVPISSGICDETYPFWLAGLLLGKAMYDETGNLVYMQKNRYLTDISRYSLNVDASKWIDNNNSLITYTKYRSQYKRHKYYFDYDAMEAYYRQHPTVRIYFDNEGGGYYLPVKDFFLYNYGLQKDIVKFSGYTLYYGGKTVLSSQKEYSFNTKVSSCPSVMHLTGNIPVGYRLEQEIRYVYDNPNFNESPSRVERLLSNGEKKIEFVRTPLDFQAGVDPVIDSMKARNIVSPVIKIQTAVYKPGSNQCNIINERVNKYDLIPMEGDKYRVLLKERLASRMFQNKTIDTSSFSLETGICSFPANDYRKEEVYMYKLKNDILLAEQINTPVQNTVIKYNDVNFLPVFKAVGISSENVDACDALKYDFGETNKLAEQNREDYNNIVKFYDEFVVIKDYLGQSIPYFLSASLNNLMDFAYRIKQLSSYKGLGVISDKISYSTIDSLYQNYPTILPYHDDCYKFCRSINNFIGIKGFAYENFIKAVNYQRDIPTTLSVIPLETLYRVTLLVQPTVSTLSLVYRVKKGNSITNLKTSSVPLSIGRWQLVSFDIDLGNLNGITGLEVDVPSTIETRSTVLVPRYLVYEMKAYDQMNRLISKFDGNGQLELYEYDSAGRLVKIMDKDNNTIKERQYNLLK